MSLQHATGPDGGRIGPEKPGPFAPEALVPLQGIPFDLPCGDPWIQRDGSPGHAYLEGARQGWSDYPEWMDFLDEGSPGFELKWAERDLYWHWWSRQLSGAKRVLDLGCGVGRFALPLLDQGVEVWGVDADLESLRRLAWRAPGRRGSLDLYWTSATALPPTPSFDTILAVEMLCYTPDAAPVVAELATRLEPGGALLGSVEGRWGWATAQDAPPGAIQEALDGTGVIDLPGDRWVRTYEEADVVQLLEDAGLAVEQVVATHYMTDGPLERCAPESLDLAAILRWEETCRGHRIWGPLNRAWTFTARRP